MPNACWKSAHWVGAASEVLPKLQGPFDLIFIDADKPHNPIYLEWALKLVRPGTVIVGVVVHFRLVRVSLLK